MTRLVALVRAQQALAIEAQFKLARFAYIHDVSRENSGAAVLAYYHYVEVAFVTR